MGQQFYRRHTRTLVAPRFWQAETKRCNNNKTPPATRGRLIIEDSASSFIKRRLFLVETHIEAAINILILCFNRVRTSRTHRDAVTYTEIMRSGSRYTASVTLKAYKEHCYQVARSLRHSCVAVRDGFPGSVVAALHCCSGNASSDDGRATELAGTAVETRIFCHA